VIMLTTNFGLVISHDDGLSWDWVCEHGEGTLATQYQLAAPPSRRLFAVAPNGVAYSDDDACGWSLADDLTSATMTDAFADPADASRVLALGSFVDPAGGPQSGLYISTDAGKSYGAAKYQGPGDSPLYSVEVGAANPRRIYLTTFRTTPGPPGAALLTSDDGGGTWALTDLKATTGDSVVRIAAVDPRDSRRVFFRVTGAQDAIALTLDGGATLTLPLVVPMRLTGFLLRASGRILVSALDDAAGAGMKAGALYESRDAGQSFSRLATRLGIRALAERAGKLYAATDNVVDGFALAVSTDDGATFAPLLRFDQVRTARTCGGLMAVCASTCSSLVTVGTFTASTCSTSASGPDAGIAPPPAHVQGHGCRLAPGGPRTPAIVLALAVAFVLARRRVTRVAP
jgi:MYXO-CTERM domain-containing protein